MKTPLVLLALTLVVSLAFAADRDAADIIRQIPKDPLLHQFPNDAWERLIALEEEGKATLTATEHAAAMRDLAEARAHLARLTKEPAYRDACGLARRVRLDPSFEGVPTRFEIVGPFVLFSEVTEGGAAAAGDVAALRTLHETFRDLFAERFDLPELASLSTADRRQLKIFVFAGQESFTAYQKRIRQPLPPGVRALYRPTDQWLIIRAGEEGAADWHLTRLLHDGTHQLVHFFTKALLERKLGGEVVWTDDRLRSRVLWFQEGIAELLSSHKRLPDGSVELLAPYAGRIREWKAARARGAAEWTFDELVQIGGGADLGRRAMKKGAREAAGLPSLFYAQAWSFVHYLWNEHREKLLDYMLLEVTGRSGPGRFRELFTDAGWEALRAGWVKHVEALLK